MKEKKEKVAKVEEKKVAEVKNVPETKPEVKEEKKADAMPEGKQAKKMNMKMIIGVLVVLLLLAAAGVAVYFFVINKGGKMPKDFQKYEVDQYSIGYPKDWHAQPDSTNNSVSITKFSQDEAKGFSSLSQLGTFLSVDREVNGKTSDKENFDNISAGKCDTVGAAVAKDLGQNGTIKSNASVKIGGVKGCVFLLSSSLLNQTLDSEIYVVVKGDDVYAISIISFNGIDKNSDFEALRKAVKSFSFK